jgi:hypothetical protein
MTSSEGLAAASDGKSGHNKKGVETPITEKKQATPRGTPVAEAQHTVLAPTSPTYPPYYIDPAQLAANGYELSDSVNYTTYVYPLSPQFSVQYYPDYSNGYQSYPGSPSLHPQSPPMNPSSPPFSPTFQYQQGGIALSPPTHAYMMPPHSAQPFPPLHISSPVLTGTASIPGSPPHSYLPGPYIIADGRKRHHHYHHHQHQQPPPDQQLEADLDSFHTHNIYVRGLPSTTTDDSFLEMCQV